MARANKRGPRTAAGKIRSSLNALRHGLAATHRRLAVPMQAIERLADAICGDGPDRADGACLPPRGESPRTPSCSAPSGSKKSS